MFHRVQSGVICSIVPSEHLANSRLERVFVGQSRETFSSVETSHSVVGVCSLFGSFVKFVVASFDNYDSELEEIRPPPKRRQIDLSLPSLVASRNKKDALYNSVIQLLEEKGLGWTEPVKFGRPFVTDLSNLLWLIDGHHGVFSSRSGPIPLLFSKFNGFNRPEKSKHRKRSISNLSRDKLLEHAATLQEYATSSWIQQPEWCNFKGSLIALIESISSYASYLAVRNKAMRRYHSSPEPAVNYSDAVNVQYLPKSPYSVSPLLASLDSTLNSASMYDKIFVNDFAPNDRRQRYLFIRELEKGLSSALFFFTYTVYTWIQCRELLFYMEGSCGKCNLYGGMQHGKSSSCRRNSIINSCFPH